MKIPTTFQFLPWILSAMLLTGSAHGLSPDPKILPLIPHNAQIVAGIGVSASSRERRKLLMFTPENALDLDDFVATTGVDDSKFIRQIFFISGEQHPTSRAEHSILAIGQFDQVRIYRTVIQNGARAQIYRGIEIVELRRFSRDRGPTDDLLWMAIIRSELALFGTVSDVREELDHFLDHVQPDPGLLRRIATLHSKDEMWCLLPDLKQYEDVRQDLGLLDRRFVDAANDGLRLQFGIHFGRRIQLDYEFAEPAEANAITENGYSDQPSDRTQENESLFAGSGRHLNIGAMRGTISVSKAQYEKWLTTLYLLGSRPAERVPKT